MALRVHENSSTVLIPLVKNNLHVSMCSSVNSQANEVSHEITYSLFLHPAKLSLIRRDAQMFHSKQS